MALRVEAVPPAEFEALVPVLSEADEDDGRIRAEITRPGRVAYRAVLGQEVIGAATMRWHSEESEAGDSDAGRARSPAYASVRQRRRTGMTMLTDADLYRRGVTTLLASWDEYARGAIGAAVRRFPGVAVAVFPNEPERAVYNNAVLNRDLTPAARAGALDAMESAYAAAGVGRFAAWVHESDPATREDLQRRGYTLDTTTRAMGMELDRIAHSLPDVQLGPAEWSEYLEYEGLAPDFLRGADHAAFHVLVARENGGIVAAALAYDAGTDCGIFNVGTAERARRRGLGTALTAAQAHAAFARGCATASLQSTPMAERVYAAVGFRDLGRIYEYVPEESGSHRAGAPLGGL